MMTVGVPPRLGSRKRVTIAEPTRELAALLVTAILASSTGCVSRDGLHRFKSVLSRPGGNSGFEMPNEPCTASANIAQQPTSHNAGSVYLHSGERYFEETDLRIPGRGMDFEWRRKYRSREGRLTPMGWNWDFSYNQSVAIGGQNPANRVVFDGYSRRDTYVPSGVNCWTADGLFRHLCVQANGIYTLTLPDKQVWKFAQIGASPASGKMLEIRDRNNNVMSFAYDGAGRLATITDTLGRPIQISYNIDGYVSQVTDFIGRAVKYAYYQDSDPGGSAGDLKSVTSPAVTGTPTGNDFPLGKTTMYTYSENLAPAALSHNLLTITDPMGTVIVKDTYSTAINPNNRSFDRVASQTFPNGVISYVYRDQIPVFSNGFATTKTIVNDRAGNVKESFYDAKNRLVLLREYTGRAPLPIGPTDDFSNRPINRLRSGDPVHFETRYVYDANSLVTSVTYPEGNTEQHTYDSANPNVRLRANKLRTERHPGPRGGDQDKIVEIWSYATDFGTEPCLCEAVSGADDDDEQDDDDNPQVGASEGDPEGFWTSSLDGRGKAYGRQFDADGNLLRSEMPAVMIGVLGGGTQIIADTWRYNAFGQITRHTNPTGRKDEYTYYESGPQAGYQKDITVDFNESGIYPTCPQTTTFQYDAVGNITATTDPHGNTETTILNQLNQVVRSIRPGPFNHQKDAYYDPNNRLVRADVQNVDDQGVVQPDAHFTTTFAYDALNQLVGSISEVDAGHSLSMAHEYDPNDNRTLTRLGEAVSGAQPANVVQNTYDERDLLFRVRRAEGSPLASTTQIDYDRNGNLVGAREGLESSPRVTTYTLDGYDRPTSTTDPEGNVTVVHYDDNGNVVSRRMDGELVDGASGANLRLAEETIVYDEIDRPVEEFAAIFNPQTGAPIGSGFSRARTFYNANSDAVRIEDDNGHANNTVYDTSNRSSVETDARGNTVTHTYDCSSNVVRDTEVDVSDLGNPGQTIVTDYTYDSLDRQASTTDDAGNLTQSFYDSRGNETRQIDARGNTARFVYDGMNRLIRTEVDLTSTGDGSGPVVDTIVTSQTWDDSSRLVGQADDNGNSTTYAYDPLNRLITTTHADGTTEERSHDVHDNVVTVTDENGTLTATNYDRLNRATSRSITRAPGILGTTFEIWKYDGLSRAVHAQDDDSLVTRAYDSLSNVLTETQKIGSGPMRTLTAVFDGEGNRTSVTYPSGRTISTTYDPLNRKKRILPAQGSCSDTRVPCQSDVDCVKLGVAPGVCVGLKVAEYWYAGSGGRVERCDLPNAVRSIYLYDNVRRMTKAQHDQNPFSGPTIDAHIFSWDPAYNKASRVDLRPGGPTSLYSYDSADRLIRSDDVDGLTNYTLDGVGNRTLLSGGLDAGPYAMSAATPTPSDRQVNQYTTTPFDSIRFYDNAGNLTALGHSAGASTGADGCPGLCGVDDDANGVPDDACELCSRGPDGLGSPLGDDLCSPFHAPPAEVAYDYRNRMIRFAGAGGCKPIVTFSYDAFGRRIEAGSTQFFNDGEEEIEEWDAGGALRAVYVFGNYLDEVIREDRDINTDGILDPLYLHGDDLYNVMVVTNSVGLPVERYDYDEFGSPKFFTGAGAPLAQSAIGNPILFNGRRYDPVTGLYYYRTRYLDPRAGRFTTHDGVGDWEDEESLGSGVSYAGNNPWTFTDPSGERRTKTERREARRENREAKRESRANRQKERADERATRREERRAKHGNKWWFPKGKRLERIKIRQAHRQEKRNLRREYRGKKRETRETMRRCVDDARDSGVDQRQCREAKRKKVRGLRMKYTRWVPFEYQGATPTSQVCEGDWLRSCVVDMDCLDASWGPNNGMYYGPCIKVSSRRIFSVNKGEFAESNKRKRAAMRALRKK